ncbi:Fpg/Nei family DNA glycosylase [Arthrobacter castelli]|uniref:Fpg/Nei family DNA glycosylase n=1 Tax=Arthrobacter castelli TaxID=271431 RepID=UPI0003FC2C14|nr:zinc finger domain-containing protein [Arthrobacter castelli]
MPEGHSLHRLASQFNSVFAGHRLRLSSPQGRFAAGASLLDNHRLSRAEAYGKQLFLTFDNELVMRVHLGLYGAWDFGGDRHFRGASSIGAPRRVGERELGSNDDADADAGYTGPPEPVGAVRARLVAAHGWADLRGPTACEVLTGDESRAVYSMLGPDPLRPDADPHGFARGIRLKGSAVGTLLMNQNLIAGVGNVYRAEVLFRQRLNPWVPGTSLDEGQTLALWDDIVAAMSWGVSHGRIVTTVDGPEGADVPPEAAHYVYRRAGLPCRVCGTTVAMAAAGGRKLFWCPQCQAG